MYGIIAEQGFQNTGDDQTAYKKLVVHVNSHCSKATQDYLWKHRAKLPQLIDDVWRWENMPKSLAEEQMSRLDALRAAASKPCVCQGRWIAAVVASFTANKINVRELCQDVFLLLKLGRSPDSPVLVLAGAAED